VPKKVVHFQTNSKKILILKEVETNKWIESNGKGLDLSLGLILDLILGLSLGLDLSLDSHSKQFGEDLIRSGIFKPLLEIHHLKVH
jgi:hypothetical protein